MISAVRKKYASMLRVVTLPHSLNPPMSGFFMPEKRRSTLNALVVANRGLSACWLFRQELLVCHVNQVKVKKHAKTAGYDRNRQSGI